MSNIYLIVHDDAFTLFFRGQGHKYTKQPFLLLCKIFFLSILVNKKAWMDEKNIQRMAIQF